MGLDKGIFRLKESLKYGKSVRDKGFVLGRAKWDMGLWKQSTSGGTVDRAGVVTKGGGGRVEKEGSSRKEQG